MSNLLSSSESRLALSKMSEVSEPRFSLQQVGPIRGTKFVRLEYRGADPNAVKSVASNAASLVISYYATNEPGWAVTFGDVECFTPPAPWEKLQDSAESCWNRFKYSSW